MILQRRQYASGIWVTVHTLLRAGRQGRVVNRRRQSRSTTSTGQYSEIHTFLPSPTYQCVPTDLLILQSTSLLASKSSSSSSFSSASACPSALSFGTISNRTGQSTTKLVRVGCLACREQEMPAARMGGWWVHSTRIISGLGFFFFFLLLLCNEPLSSGAFLRRLQAQASILSCR
jgi:hypothetical protein